MKLLEKYSLLKNSPTDIFLFLNEMLKKDSKEKKLLKKGK